MVRQLKDASVADTDGLEVNYKYGILREMGNKKYAKKESRRNIRVVALEVTNLTDAPINFKDDVEIFSGDRQILLMEPEQIKHGIRQVAPLYLLWSLFWLTITKCENNDCSVIPLPVGVVIGLTNMSMASGANRNLLYDLKRFDLQKKTIEPGETVFGLIGIEANSNEALEIRFKE
jgi:hypothetical protein